MTNTQLNVALAMLTMVPGGMGGSETYGKNLTRTLASSTKVNAKAYVAQQSAGFSQGVPEVVIPEVSGGASSKERIRTIAQARRHSKTIVDRMRPMDVYHVPFTVAAPPPPPKVAFVQSLFDVQHLDLPQLFTTAEKLYRRFNYEGAARKADAVVTISQFAKDRIVDRVGLDPERVFVAHLGVDTATYTPNLGPRENFVFYPARGWPHKNHQKLIEAIEILRQSEPDLRLVLTGGALETLGPVPDWVQVLGLVPAKELNQLFQKARALVFPSRYEGFGLPPLEAMASGCPVAASNAGSLPEICGQAATLFDPEDPKAIAVAVSQTLANAESLVPLGLERVKDFTWEKCALAHEEAYQFAVSHPHER